MACGADALGFVFAKSPRQADEATVKIIGKALGEGVLKVGVFLDESVPRMLRTAERCGLDTLQMHGAESDRVVRQVQGHGFQVLKAFRATGLEALKQAEESPADAVLFDTAFGGRFGGTGKTFDWHWLSGRTIRRPWFISGGLNPQNVKALLAVVRPYGLDVSSGVEVSPGKKNHQSVKEFIRHAKFA